MYNYNKDTDTKGDIEYHSVYSYDSFGNRVAADISQNRPGSSGTKTNGQYHFDYARNENGLINHIHGDLDKSNGEHVSGDYDVSYEIWEPKWNINGEDKVFPPYFSCKLKKVQDNANATVPKEETTKNDQSFPRQMFAKVDELMVRTGPGTDYQAIDKLYTGDAIEVQSISDGWAKINWKGKTAYVYAEYIDDKK